MKALRRFTVRISLPEPLAPLLALAANLRWSWHAPSQDLFAAVDRQLWTESRDPARVLAEVPGERLRELATDEEFLRRMHAVADELHRYLTEPRWYQGLADAALGAAPAAIGYFSPEFGITEVLPQYSGGLGILAGDHLKAASDLGVPVIGVGLLYRGGYFTQGLTADGWQLEHYPPIDPHGLPVAPLTDVTVLPPDAPRGGGRPATPVKVVVGLPDGRDLHAQVWIAQVGRVPLLLLDSDVEENGPAERQVTDRLYGGGTDHRFRQELLLGIGGVRALRAFCDVTGHPEPTVFHTNEGHAGFLGLERMRELVEDEGLTFPEALAAVRAGTLFTTHTPVAAGIDRFPVSLVEHQFGGGNLQQGMAIQDVLALGAEDDPGVFNMAHMGLRLAQRCNGVSRLHGDVSRRMFAHLWPGFDADEVPIGHVTNGVHGPSWVAREIVEVGVRESGPILPLDPKVWDAARRVPADEVWALRSRLRADLVTQVRRRLRASWLQRGASAAELGWVEEVLDPDVLTIGFARRVPSYKRLTLVLRDPERLRRLLLDPDRPLQLVVAGKAHPADDGGKALVQQMVQFADDPRVRHRIVFLPDYEIGMARHLYHGCDVWLNNPLRPLEACGTSGMKAAINGGLNLSVRDGWWDELYDGQNGWAIPTADLVTDPVRRDDLEAAGLYELLERSVVPAFYERDEAGVPPRWVHMVRHTLSGIGFEVQASRMVRDYVTDYYLPAARAADAVAGSAYAGARDLAAWRARVAACWSAVRVSFVEGATDGPPVLGGTLSVRAEVDLGALSPADVQVQAAYGRVDDTDGLAHPRLLALTRVAGEGNRHRYEGSVPLARTGPYGYAVRVVPSHPLLASDAEAGLVVFA